MPSDSSRHIEEFNDNLRSTQQEFASLGRSVADSRKAVQASADAVASSYPAQKKATEDLVSMISAASKVLAKEIAANKGTPRDDITKIATALSDVTNATIPLIEAFKGLKASMAAADAAGKSFRSLFYNEAKPVYEKTLRSRDPFTGEWSNPKQVEELNKVTGKMEKKTQAGWDFGAFTGDKGAGAAAGAYTNAAFAAIGAIGALDSATNVKGKGNRALRGAATGASIGTQIMPGWGTAIGAGVGALVGLFRKPGMEDVFNKVKQNYGGIEISDTLATSIAKDSKDKFKGDRRAAEVFSLDKIVGEGGGVKDTNVKALTARLRDAFSMKETGKFSDEQLTQTLDKNFAAFATHVTNSKKLASAEFQELIALNKRFGSESKVIQEFLNKQTSGLGGNVSAMAGPLVEQFTKLTDAVKETDAQIKKMEAEGGAGTAAHAALVQQLAGQQANVTAEATKSRAEFESLGLIALASFNAAVAGGTNTLTAMQQLAPGLNQLVELQKMMGIESENAAVKDLIAFQGKIEGNKTLVASAGALGEAMLALSSIGGLNEETFKAIEAQGLVTFDRLNAAEFSANEQLVQMKGFLEAARQAHEELGFPIDERTAQYIEQAEKAGILKKTQDDMNKDMQNGLNKCTDALLLVAKCLGADIPEAADKTKKALDGIPNRKIIDIDYRTNGYPGDAGGGSGDGGGGSAESNGLGFAKGTGGFRNFGSGTLAMLHGWEAVIPFNQMAGGGGAGESVQVNVWLNDAIIGRAAARGLPAMLDVYGATR
jgi:hypothetical protein